MTELDLPSTIALNLPNPDDLLNFEVNIKPDEGIYQSGLFPFKFEIGFNYPHEPPKVKCLKKIYHPNIDLQGNVCLNILREDWKPVLNLNSVILGLQYLFLEPNPQDPLNKDAAKDFQFNLANFKTNVKRSMEGYSINGEPFDRVL
jgi:ubiquitin-conjugating enzyme E2 M